MYRNMNFPQIASAACNSLIVADLRHLKQVVADRGFGSERRCWLPPCGTGVPVQLPYYCTVPYESGCVVSVSGREW